MGFRFKKSVRIAKGVKLNFGKKGVSMTLGGKRARVTTGTSGTRVSGSVPGTGLSYSQKLGGGSSSGRARGARSARTPAQTTRVEMAISISIDDETGEVSILDGQGRPAVPEVDKAVRKQHKQLLEDTVQAEVDRREQGRVMLEQLHLHMSHVFSPPVHDPLPVPLLSLPSAPTFPWYTRLFALVLSPVRRRVEAQVTEHESVCETRRAQHAEQVTQTQDAEARRKRLFEARAQGDPGDMEAYLAERLAELDWPYETLVAFEVADASTLLLDVDLPEIEDLPTDRAKLKKRPLSMVFKAMSQADQRRQYMRHIHAIGLVLTALALRSLPTLERVELSAYSQRNDPKTARVRDMYLYSARITRAQLDAIDASRLSELDVVACFEGFELRRKMTKTGIFKEIEPFEHDSPS